MRNLPIALFALLLAVPSAATSDAGTFVSTPIFINFLTSSGTREHAAMFGAYQQSMIGGAVDTTACIWPVNDSTLMNPLCIDKDGNVTAAGTLIGHAPTVDGGYGKPWDGG